MRAYIAHIYRVLACSFKVTLPHPLKNRDRASRIAAKRPVRLLWIWRGMNITPLAPRIRGQKHLR